MNGLYIHIPFCRQKCIYCAFYSTVALSKKKDFLDALECEIEQTLHYLPSRQLDTIYFGGGTPTLLKINELESIINKIRRHYFLSSDFEFTIEANPEQIERSYLKDLISLGINRISFGVQSFNDDTLRFLGRKHSAEEAISVVYEAQNAGFENISIDLIYGISQRGNEGWEQDLLQAFKLPINHLSCYALTKEENTILWKQIQQNKLAEIDEDRANTEFFQLLRHARENGFLQYEISNFARERKISRHNSNYWEQQPYLGLGPSAHSFNGHSRKWNAGYLQHYIEYVEKGCADFESEELSLNDRYNEYVMLGLRTSKGISLSNIEQQFGQPFRQHAEQALTHINSSHLQYEGEQITLTDDGKLFADGIAEELFWE